MTDTWIEESEFFIPINIMNTLDFREVLELFVNQKFGF